MDIKTLYIPEAVLTPFLQALGLPEHTSIVVHEFGDKAKKEIACVDISARHFGAVIVSDLGQRGV